MNILMTDALVIQYVFSKQNMDLEKVIISVSSGDLIFDYLMNIRINSLVF